MGNNKTLSVSGQVLKWVKDNLQLLLIWSVLIFVVVMSLMPGSTMVSIFVAVGTFIGIPSQWVSSNVWEISNYGHLFTSIVLTYWTVSRFKSWWLPLFALILFSFATIEYLQYFIPSRQTSFGDFLYDLVGSLAGLLFVYVYNLCFWPKGIKSLRRNLTLLSPK